MMLTILQVFVCPPPDTVPITTSWWGKDPGVLEMEVVRDSDISVWAESLWPHPQLCRATPPPHRLDSALPYTVPSSLRERNFG